MYIEYLQEVRGTRGMYFHPKISCRLWIAHCRRPKCGQKSLCMRRGYSIGPYSTGHTFLALVGGIQVVQVVLSRDTHPMTFFSFFFFPLIFHRATINYLQQFSKKKGKTREKKKPLSRATYILLYCLAFLTQQLRETEAGPTICRYVYIYIYIRKNTKLVDSL